MIPCQYVAGYLRNKDIFLRFGMLSTQKHSFFAIRNYKVKNASSQFKTFVCAEK